MTKKEFDALMDGLWQIFQDSAAIIGTLEEIGLIVEGDTEGGRMHLVYDIQDRVAHTIMNMFGITDEDILADIDQVFIDNIKDVRSGREIEETMSGHMRGQILDILTNADPDKKLPWEKKSEEGFCCRHSGSAKVSEKGRRVYTGWLWNGAGSAYIIPGSNGISYDEETGVLTAHAVEVDKATIRMMAPEESV